MLGSFSAMICAADLAAASAAASSAAAFAAAISFAVATPCARSFWASGRQIALGSSNHQNLFELKEVGRRLHLDDGVRLMVRVRRDGFDRTHAQPARIHLVSPRGEDLLSGLIRESGVRLVITICPTWLPRKMARISGRGQQNSRTGGRIVNQQNLGCMRKSHTNLAHDSIGRHHGLIDLQPSAAPLSMYNTRD